ncbi:hypothetical protein [Winogradskyella sp.]|uniref:hypothetical protein n=1 Tax=Winogradskyella sp. TaxID=1883156 RepID=UPI00260CABC4|nr:hypothetical protein [Winogradskyella sp.]
MKDFNWKHINLFYLIFIILIAVVNWIWKSADPNTIEMFYADLTMLIVPPIIVTLMILTYKSNKRLTFGEKIIVLMGFLFVGYIAIVTINIFNFFERTITSEDILEGAKRSAIYCTMLFFVCLPIVRLIKSRLIQEK